MAMANVTAPADAGNQHPGPMSDCCETCANFEQMPLEKYGTCNREWSPYFRKVVDPDCICNLYQPWLPFMERKK